MPRENDRQTYVPSKAKCGGWASPNDAEDGTLSSVFDVKSFREPGVAASHESFRSDEESTVIPLTPFAVAWTFTAVYGAVLLAVAIRIGISVVRNRRAGQQFHDSRGT